MGDCYFLQMALAFQMLLYYNFYDHEEYLFIAIFFALSSAFLSAFSSTIYAMGDTQDKVVMPEYPGGERALHKYILNETRYPDEARNKGEVGEVLVSFTVEANGIVTGVKVIRRVSKTLDEEAVRVVKNMRIWRPAKKNGRRVRCDMTIPINFKIIKEADKTSDGDGIRNFFEEFVF